MAIIEKELPFGRWERTFTGEDIPKVKGALTATGNDSYRKAFHRNEGIGFEKVADQWGQPTWVRKDQVEEAVAAGYGRVGLNPTMIVPELPWEKKQLSPGRHKFKYDKASGQMVEVL